MNAAELARALHAAKSDVDAAMDNWLERIREDADADDTARRAKARAYVALREKQPKSTVGLLEAMVDLETADAQKAARLADGLKRAAAQAVDGKKQWLSALQSLASLTKAEAQLAAWEPREVAS